MASGIVVDADSHIMEPANLWQEYMDPEFRSRALKISVDEFGLEYLDIDGKVSIGYNGGTLGRIGGCRPDPRVDDGASHSPLR